ncbi:MAG: hypothetical protein Q9168_007088, partial [Polycauliona sp. 1 TL-2023]
MADSSVAEVGDQVSWQYGSSHPGGEVAEKKDEGEIAIQSKRGNTIKRSAEPDNPAVHVARPGNDVVKQQSELQVEEKNAAAGGQDANTEKDAPAPSTEGNKPEDPKSSDDHLAVPNGAQGKEKSKSPAPSKAKSPAPAKKTATPKATPASKKRKAAEEEPATTAADETEAATASETEPPAKKARGRPKGTGSSAKKPAAPKPAPKPKAAPKPAPKPAATKPKEAAPPAAEKKKPGRKPAAAAAAAKKDDAPANGEGTDAPKGRGRPKGSGSGVKKSGGAG